MSTAPAFDDLLRGLAPQVLGALVRRYGHFDACEDAVQEAMLAAAVQWPDQGVPQNPRGWLVTVASRRVTDQLRSDQARHRREDTTAAFAPRDELAVEPDDAVAIVHRQSGTGHELRLAGSTEGEESLRLVYHRRAA